MDAQTPASAWLRPSERVSGWGPHAGQSRLHRLWIVAHDVGKVVAAAHCAQNRFRILLSLLHAASQPQVIATISKHHAQLHSFCTQIESKDSYGVAPGVPGQLHCTQVLRVPTKSVIRQCNDSQQQSTPNAAPATRCVLLHEQPSRQRVRIRSTLRASNVTLWEMSILTS